MAAQAVAWWPWWPHTVVQVESGEGGVGVASRGSRVDGKGSSMEGTDGCRVRLVEGQTGRAGHGVAGGQEVAWDRGLRTQTDSVGGAGREATCVGTDGPSAAWDGRTDGQCGQSVALGTYSISGWTSSVGTDRRREQHIEGQPRGPAVLSPHFLPVRLSPMPSSTLSICPPPPAPPCPSVPHLQLHPVRLSPCPAPSCPSVPHAMPSLSYLWPSARVGADTCSRPASGGD